jgi:hypothetical protein
MRRTCAWVLGSLSPLPLINKSNSPSSAYTLREASTGVVITNTAPALLQFLKTKTT